MNLKTNKTEIKFVKFINMHGRVVITAQLYSDENQLIFDGTLSQILTIVEKHQFEIVNAQEMLDTIVRVGGFGA